MLDAILRPHPQTKPLDIAAARAIRESRAARRMLIGAVRRFGDIDRQKSLYDQRSR